MMQQELNILLRKEVFDHLIVTDYAMDGRAQAFLRANTFISNSHLGILRRKLRLITCYNQILDSRHESTAR